MSHPPYYFFHEYLDEQRRFRVHKHTADTEQQARTNHRQAASFQWVTNHTEPTLSSLFGKVEGTYKAIAPSQRPGIPYRTHATATPMPDDVSQLIARYTTRTNLHD